ncbi:MAG TPA: hypothetical protein VFG00_05750 [Acidothermaceae bacterium]|nr:hypothetical protein [Acidothermaceae bacterium]
MASRFLVAALLVAFSVAGDVQHGLTIALLPVLVLASVLIIGELRPIRISHGDGNSFADLEVSENGRHGLQWPGAPGTR